MATNKHVFPHKREVTLNLREALFGHKAFAIWMTGLSGSGKSTIASRLERELLLTGHKVYMLDGDSLRGGLNTDLDFSDVARKENLRRAAEVAKLMTEAGLIVICSFISPFREDRQLAKEVLKGRFVEVYVEADLATCEARDPKGLYRRAREGAIPRFTGISSPYEPPQDPDVRLDTARHSLEECVRQLGDVLLAKQLVRAGRRVIERHPSFTLEPGLQG